MANSKSTASLDMTQGSALKLIVSFSLPLIAGNALQQLYNMVDSVVVGQFVGATALAAVGAAFPIIFLLASLFMGLGNGAMIMVSQYYGGGEADNLRRTIDTLYTGMLVAAVPLTIIGILCTNPILTILQIPDDARQEAYTYLVIIMAGFIGSLGYNANAGILQGIGDSKTPLLLLAIACVMNIVLDLIFVVVFGWGVAGVAIATIIAQAFSWIFGIFYINKKYPALTIRPLAFKFDKKIFATILKLGLPASVQNALFSVASIMLTRLVNSYGSAFAAGFSAANRLDTFAFLPIQSISVAIITFTGQNIGAGKLHRVKEGTKASMLLSLGFALAGLLIIPAGPLLMRMFSADPAVIDSGMYFVERIMPFYTLLAVSFVLNSVMRGAGEAVIPLIASIISTWAARIPAAYLLAHFLGPANMHFSYAIGWSVGLAISIPYYLSGRWRGKGITSRAGANIAGEANTAEGG